MSKIQDSQNLSTRSYAVSFKNPATDRKLNIYRSARSYFDILSASLATIGTISLLASFAISMAPMYGNSAHETLFCGYTAGELFYTAIAAYIVKAGLNIPKAVVDSLAKNRCVTLFDYNLL